MKAQYRNRVPDIEVLRPVKGLSRLFGLSSRLARLAGKSLTQGLHPAEATFCKADTEGTLVMHVSANITAAHGVAAASV